MGDISEKVTLGAVVAVGGAAVVAGTVVVGATVGAGFGALGGEILDHVPYLRHAIPDGFAYLANYINPDTAKSAKIALEGNLDKVGAAMGFIGGFYKASLRCKHKND